jgi:hypothetical protein
MAVLVNVQATVVQSYLDGGFGLSTAYEGFTFTPVYPTPWARLWWLPVSRNQRLQTIDRVLGILQVDLSYERDQGTAAIRGKAAEVMAYYAPHRSFTSNAQTIAVRSTEESSLREAEGWQRMSVSITFKAAVTRSS